MNSKTKDSVAMTLEAEKKLLPYMPYLLQDLWAMGCSLEFILQGVRKLNLTGNITALDLGCGKGAVSVALASEFGITVTGIDAMPAFLETAGAKATTCGVSHLCSFLEGDIIEYTLEKRNFDMVILASLGGIFGSFTDTILRLRSQIRTGGYMIIDDGYLKRSAKLVRTGYQHYTDYNGTLSQLTHYQDKIIDEISTTELSIDINKDYQEKIEKRGGELIISHPEIKKDLQHYIKTQAEECAVIESEIEGALWIIQKSGDN